jgi:hypothetical protein
LEAYPHQDNAADNANHAQRPPEKPEYQGAEEQKEKHQQHGVNARLARDRAMFVQVFALEKFQEDW